MEVEKCTEEEVNQTYKMTNNVGISIIGLQVFKKKYNPGIIEYLKNQPKFVVTIVGLIFTVTSEFISLLNYEEFGFITMTDMFLCFGFTCLSLYKIMSLYWNRYKIQDMIAEIKKLWPRSDSPQAVIDIKNKFLKNLHHTTYGLLWMFTIIAFSYNIEPLVLGLFAFIFNGKCNMKLPYVLWLPFNPLTTEFFFFTYLMAVWVGSTSVAGYLVYDTMLQILCSHIAMLLEIIQHDLLHLIPDDWSDEDMAENYDMLRLKLVKIVNRHLKLIELTQKTEDMFNCIIGLNLMATSIHICVLGFIGMISPDGKLLKVVVTGSSLATQVYFLTWYGNLLVEKSLGIVDAVYNSKWYNGNTPIKRSLSIVMIRASRPLYLTGMKFSIIELTRFTAMVSSSWSYYTLLRTMYSPD